MDNRVNETSRKSRSAVVDIKVRIDFSQIKRAQFGVLRNCRHDA
jgi:hypothetical protein